ncbi:UNKNOWN [Stylonychia lemnae]|uniref:Uncharacterized protein n=1 Tax=Stylonychia lemnae TaxID=5949 RepID=A0A078AE83_STYLE|nr:UNKNOWN [Stylonychia lemnae]|eukprot:CDW79228.1 UNKNOWN [Stylonychia lemnae]
MKQIDIMGTIIARNEELEREFQIVARALELREQANRKTQELELFVGQLQNQLTQEKKLNQDYFYMREQDNSELTLLESEMISLKENNRDLQKQLELSGNLLEDKIKKLENQQDIIDNLKDEIDSLKTNSDYRLRQQQEEIKILQDGNMRSQFQIKELQKQIREQLDVYQREIKEAYLGQAQKDEQITTGDQSMFVGGGQRLQHQQNSSTKSLIVNNNSTQINRIIEEEREKNRKLLSEIKQLRTQYRD